jgi:hypothetical protein
MSKNKCRVYSNGLSWQNCSVEEAVHTIIKACLDEGAPVETASQLIADLINGETVSVNDFLYELELNQ